MAFLDEIREQPDALRRVAASAPAELGALTPFAEKLRRGEFQSVIFTGMGSSLTACIPATVLLAQYGIPALTIEASEILAAYQPLLGPKTLVVTVSQSGQSAEVVRMVGELSDKVPLIGITNTPDSPLAKRSAVTLSMHAGPEATVSTKTYTCSLAILHLAALALTGKPLAPACDAIHASADQLSGLLPAFEAQMPDIVRHIAPVHFIEFLGRGASRASALTAALITKETAKMPTEGMAGGQFRHGPWEVLAPDITVCLFCGWKSARALDLALAADILARGGKAFLIGAGAVEGAFHTALPALDPFLAPLVEIVPVQIMAGELTRTRGFTPGQFRYSGKITTTE